MKFTSIRKIKKRFKSVCFGVSDFHLYVNIMDFGYTNKFKIKQVKKNMIDIHYKINGYNLYITKLAIFEFFLIEHYLGNIEYNYEFDILSKLKESDLNSDYFKDLKSELYKSIFNNIESYPINYYKGNELWCEVKDKKYVILSLLGTPINRDQISNEINDINDLIDKAILYSRDLPNHKLIINNFKQFIGGGF